MILSVSSGNGGNLKKVVCAVCGKEFWARANGQKYCSDECKLEVNKKIHRKEEFTCACCGKKFIEDVTKAPLYCPEHRFKASRQLYYARQEKERETRWTENSRKNRKVEQAKQVKCLRPGIRILYKGEEATMGDPCIPTIIRNGVEITANRKYIVIA